MIDAHCHLDLFAPEQDPGEALAAGMAVGVDRVIAAGVDPAGWRAQAALARRHPAVSVTFGLHPWAVAAAEDEALAGLLAELEAALQGGLGVAPVGLGELGLDHGRRGPKPTRARQERAFRAQLALARALDLPVVVHVVQAHGRALEILAEGLPARGGMVHRYSGPVELVGAYLDIGIHLSFSPEILYKPRTMEALRRVPLDRLLLETDAPDALPASAGGAPVGLHSLPGLISAAAAVRGQDPAALASATAATAARLFALPGGS